MDDLDRLERALPHLPIFPLPGAVLLPHTLVPLHIFEPRYRKLTRDCDEGLRMMGLAHVPDERAAGERPPGVLPVLGVGVLARVDRLPGGRFNLILRGVARARILDELSSGEPYRLVRAQLLTPRELGPAKAPQLADALRRMVLALTAARPGAETQALAQLAARARDPGELADVVAGILVSSSRERQLVLETIEIVERLQLVTHLAAGALAETASPSSAPN